MTSRKTTGRTKASIIGLLPLRLENIASWLGIRAAETAKVLRNSLQVSVTESEGIRFWYISPSVNRRTAHTVAGIFWSLNRDNETGLNPISWERVMVQISGPSTCTAYRVRSPGLNWMICPTRPLHPGLSISPKITQSVLAKWVDVFNFSPKAVWSCSQHPTALSMLIGKL